VTVDCVGPEFTGCAVGEDRKDFCDPVPEELRGVRICHACPGSDGTDSLTGRVRPGERQVGWMGQEVPVQAITSA